MKLRISFVSNSSSTSYSPETFDLEEIRPVIVQINIKVDIKS